MPKQPARLFEADRPLDEVKLMENRPLVEAILHAEQVGPALSWDAFQTMTTDDFMVWLKSQ